MIKKEAPLVEIAKTNYETGKENGVNGLAIASMVFGISSLFFSAPIVAAVAIILAVISIVLGCFALFALKDKKKCKGMADAGIIISLVCLVLNILPLIDIIMYLVRLF